MKFAYDCFRDVIKNQPTKIKIKRPNNIDFTGDKELIEKHLNIFGLSWDGVITKIDYLEMTYIANK
jgi:hypothetical protein